MVLRYKYLLSFFGGMMPCLSAQNEYETPLKDWFLPRFIGRGFSDQANVPKDLHDKVIDQLINDFSQKFGDDFVNIAYKGIEDDILITMYIK